MLADVARGGDPKAAERARCSAPTVAELADRFLAEHAATKKRASSVRMDRVNLRLHVPPALGCMKVQDVTRADVAYLHHRMRATPGAGNRVLALLSKMFNLAERWGPQARPHEPVPARRALRGARDGGLPLGRGAGAAGRGARARGAGGRGDGERVGARLGAAMTPPKRASAAE
jgi:hypothetical protein